MPRKSARIEPRGSVLNDSDWYTLVEYSDQSVLTTLDAEERSRWDALVYIYRRLWFTRVWVIQEVGMASLAVVMCGESEISWTELKDAAGCIDDRAQPFAIHFGIETEIQRCFDLYWIFSAAGSKQTFVETLYEAKSFLSTNPKDKVYALLAHPSAQLPNGLTVELDYDRPMDDWYICLAARILRSTHSLQLLSAVQHSTEESIFKTYMPSWVPQWSERPWSYMLWHTIRDKTYRTGADTLPEFDLTSDKTLLKAQGILFDYVTIPGGTISTEDYSLRSEISTNPIQTLTELLKTGGASSRAIYSSEEAWIRAHFMTLTAGVFMGGQRDFESYQQWRTGSFGESPEITEGGAILFKTTAEVWSDKRKLYLTSKGYVGLGPSVLQKNDAVVVLFGCLVPFILRQQGDEYRLVGETYVHGIMMGEAIEMLREQALHTQAFCLR